MFIYKLTIVLQTADFETLSFLQIKRQVNAVYFYRTLSFKD